MNKDKSDREILEDLHRAVVGDEEYGTEGLLGRQKKTEQYIEKDKKQKWYAAGVVGALIIFKDRVAELIF